MAENKRSGWSTRRENTAYLCKGGSHAVGRVHYIMSPYSTFRKPDWPLNNELCHLVVP